MASASTNDLVTGPIEIQSTSETNTRGDTTDATIITAKGYWDNGNKIDLNTKLFCKGDYC